MVVDLQKICSESKSVYLLLRMQNDKDVTDCFCTIVCLPSFADKAVRSALTSY